MADEHTKFTHIGLKEDTQKRISILAKVANSQPIYIYELVDQWAKEKWEEAKEAGVVTDAMLNPPAHWVNQPVIPTKKRRTQRLGRDI